MAIRIHSWRLLRGTHEKVAPRGDSSRVAGETGVTGLALPVLVRRRGGSGHHDQEQDLTLRATNIDLLLWKTPLARCIFIHVMPGCRLDGIQETVFE
jgi:hypothetical protein